jgi:radical SAM protein with 4Fe4S-binding SPASM domain
MTDEIFNVIVEQLANFPEKPVVSLHGTGEPLLYKKLGKRINKLSKLGIPVTLTTNGSLLDRNRSFEVIDAGVDTVQFSIETLSKQVYEKIRVGLDLNQVLDNLASFVEIRDKFNKPVKIELVMIIHSDNRDGVKEYGDFFQKNFRRGDMLTIVHQHDFAQNYESNITASKISCSTLINNISIQYDGIVNLCCVDSEQKYNMGNLLDNSILDIFNNVMFNEYRKLHANGNRDQIDLCSNCTVPECHSMIRTYYIN